MNIKEILNKSNTSKCLSIEECEELKRELTKRVFNSNNDYLIHYYYKNKDKFTNMLEELRTNTNLNNINKGELKLLSFYIRLNKYDYEYILSL